MAINIVVPDLGESVVEATVGRWLKNEGDPVKAGDPVVELETDKVNLEVSAERDGVLAHITRKTGEDVKIGDVLGEIEAVGEAVKAGFKPAQSTPKPPESNGRPAQPEAEKVTPVARKVAEEHGIDLSKVQPSGVAGRVTKEDVERFIAQQGQTTSTVGEMLKPTTAPPARVAPPPRPSMTVPAPAQVLEIRPNSNLAREERVKLSRRRRTIAQRLVEAQHTAAMLTTFNEIDMSAVMALREQRKAPFKDKYGVNLGFMSFFTKAVIGAIKAFPRLNAELDGDEMVIKKYYDIGIAVGSAEGLVVPVLRDADRMSFAEIEKQIKRFAEEVEKGTLSLEDLRGGTFTITNGGVFGSMMSTPILNAPQVGILGLHKIEKRPVVVNDQIVIRPMMYVALSYDHRIVDGRESVQFLVRVKELIEDSNTLLLEG